MSHNKKISFVIVAFFTLFFISVAAVNIIQRFDKNNKTYTENGLYFDTIVNITVYNKEDAQLLTECMRLCDKYEQMLSRTIEGSDVYRINNAGGKSVEVSDETAFLIEKSLEYSEMTEGKIDITVAPLCDLWNFADNRGKNVTPPPDEEIMRLLEHVDYTKVKVEGNTVTLEDPKAAIDLGFIAKGYIADRIKDYLLENNVQSAVISLGGNTVLIGNKPDGSKYKVGIRKPFTTENECIDTLEAANTSIVTSGTYERYFEYDGNIYHHILDATTGYPSATEYNAVTVVSDDSMTADALSTTCLILGEAESRKFKANKKVSDIRFYN